MRLNRTSEWKVMTISISRELPLFNFERLDIWCAWIGPPCEKLWPFEFLDIFRGSISGVSICNVPESDLRVTSYDHFNFSRASVVQLWASRYLMCLNRTSELKVMTILISRELPLFNNQCLDILCTWTANLSEKLWQFTFLASFRCSISRVSIYYAPESNIWVKSYDHFNFLRAFFFNFERLDMWCSGIGPPCERLWAFEFLESLRSSISSVSTCDVPESVHRV